MARCKACNGTGRINALGGAAYGQADDFMQCSQCHGFGRVDDPIGSRRNPGAAQSGGFGGRTSTFPFGFRVIILGCAGLAAWRAWTLHSNDLPFVWAFLTFFAVVILLAVALNIIMRPVASLILFGSIFAFDIFILEGVVWEIAQSYGYPVLQSALAMFL